MATRIGVSVEAMPRIIVDCTHTFQTGAGTGIQRVVRHLTDALMDIANPPELEILAVRIHGGELVALPVEGGKVAFAKSTSIRELHSATDAHRRLEAVLAWGLRANRVLRSSALGRWLEAGPNESGLARLVEKSMPGPPAGQCLELRPTDIFVALDSSWVYDVRSVLDALGRAGATRVAFLCDILPRSHPQWFTPGTRRYFEGWLKALVPRVDGVVAISRATCEAYREEVGRWPRPPRAHPECTAIRLGAQIGEAATEAARPRLRELIGPGRPPAFLTVGTLEPRKNIGFALDIFDELAGRDLDFQWHIVGSPGWLAEDTARRIRAHPLFGDRLHWWVGLTDGELDWCYRNAGALVAVSRAEGFGLPLVEARLHGLPVFASDIAVFHEVLEGEARFLPLSSAPLAAAALEDFLRRGAARDAGSRVARRWEDCAREFAEVLLAIDARRRRAREGGEFA